MEQKRESNGRWTHRWSHAGFDINQSEWAVCDDCMRVKHWGQQATKPYVQMPKVIPNRHWTREEIESNFSADFAN